MASAKLKKAIAQGRVVLHNPHSGEASVFLLDANHQQVSIIIPSNSSKEVAPKFCPLNHVEKSRNLDRMLREGHLRVELVK